MRRTTIQGIVVAGWVGMIACDVCSAQITSERSGEDVPLVQHPERARTLCEVEGRVQSVETATGWVVIEDSRAQTWRIHIDDKTPITNAENRELRLTDLKQSDAVRIYYTTWDMNAQQVDVVATPFSLLIPS